MSDGITLGELTQRQRTNVRDARSGLVTSRNKTGNADPIYIAGAQGSRQESGFYVNPDGEVIDQEGNRVRGDRLRAAQRFLQAQQQGNLFDTTSQEEVPDPEGKPSAAVRSANIQSRQQGVRDQQQASEQQNLQQARDAQRQQQMAQEEEEASREANMSQAERDRRRIAGEVQQGQRAILSQERDQREAQQRQENRELSFSQPQETENEGPGTGSRQSRPKITQNENGRFLSIPGGFSGRVGNALPIGDNPDELARNLSNLSEDQIETLAQEFGVDVPEFDSKESRLRALASGLVSQAR